jgi:hypothetical protein
VLPEATMGAFWRLRAFPAAAIEAGGGRKSFISSQINSGSFQKVQPLANRRDVAKLTRS